MATASTIRTYLRFPVQCPVYYLGPDFLGKGIIHDVSRNGWRVDGDHPVKSGMALVLSVLLPGESIPVKVERAIVRWTCDGAFGVKIVQMQPTEWARLGRAIANLLKQNGFATLNPRDSNRGVRRHENLSFERIPCLAPLCCAGRCSWLDAGR
jgi:hypothetical protein